jgi:hypothetical protein
MRKIHPIWAAVAALLVLASLALCFYGYRGGMLYMKTAGDPQETVNDFIRAMKVGDSRSAYALLSNYDSLGIENQPQTEDGRVLMDALRLSYRCELVGDCVQQGDSAEQIIRLTALDLNKLDEARAAAAEGEGAETPAVPLAQLLMDKGSSLYTTAEYAVTLRYADDQWRIVLDDALLKALAGGR